MAVSDLADNDRLDRDLLAIIDEEIAGGITFANDGADSRSRALDYYRGEMADLPADPDWSHAVDRTVASTIDFMLPGLLRVFAGAGQIVTYSPAKAGDEGSSQQATDYINYLWENELDGYRVLLTAIDDCLKVRNGIIKAFWDSTPEYDTQDLTGLGDNDLTFLMQDPEVEIVAYGESAQVVVDPMTGAPTPLHDVRVRHVTMNGRMRLECVPPEDFGLSARAKTIEDARIVWHYARKTRSDLVSEGYDPAMVADMPAWTANPGEWVDRQDEAMPREAPTGNTAMQEVDVYECYMRYDADGDGIAERRKVVVCGPNGARKLLSDDPWPDDLPFVDLTPQPVPHRWQGQSIADTTMDIQRIKTALTRQMLDNLYLVNRPQRAVVERNIINPDEVMNPKIAGVIRVKEANSIENLDTVFIGDKALLGLNYFDNVVRQRTGASQATAALDSTALDPQTATAEQIDHDASYSRVELVARNIAELGLKPLFRKMLRIMCRNQDRARMIQLRGEWVPMDPRAWSANMHATINVGLGTGSRERDLSMLAGIGKQQDQIVAQLGPNNPIVPPSAYVNTRHKMVEAAGLRNADQYFKPISDQDFTQWQQSQPPKPDPKAMEAQARTQIHAQKAQSDTALHGQKAQAEMTIKGQKAAADVQTDREKVANDLVLRRDEMHLEAGLKALEIQHNAGLPNETNIRRPN